MSKDLHPSILAFFHERMEDHDGVRAVRDISTDDHYIFEIDRRYGTIRVWLSDAYLFTETDLFAKPDVISAGDFILVGKPEGGYSLDYELLKQAKIGIGKIGKFMGALNKREMWTYLTAEERDRLEKKGRPF